MKSESLPELSACSTAETEMPVATASPDDASSTCPRCEYFLADFGSAARTISCPDCHRRIADVSYAVLRIPTSPPLLDLVPESVARENTTIAFSGSSSRLIILSDLTEQNVKETVEKLRFILNVAVDVLHAEAEAIRHAIVRDYGPPEDDDTWSYDCELLD